MATTASPATGVVLATLLLAAGCAGTKPPPSYGVPPPSRSAPTGSTPSGSQPTGSTPSGSQPTGSTPSRSQPTGSTPSPGGLPTLSRPAKPPKTPTDLVAPDVIAGRVTRGGTGPCYRVVTDEGVTYALYGTSRVHLPQDGYVRVRYGPATAGADCGPGRPATLLEATVLG